jgi:type III secretion system FlhB-like substrate exporter
MPAPLVLARGTGELAQRLLRIAREHDVPVVDSKELAESLVVIDPGEFIPEPFYQAVAEIVGFVWRTSTQSDETIHDGSN